MRVVITKVPDFQPIKSGVKLFDNGGGNTANSVDKPLTKAQYDELTAAAEKAKKSTGSKNDVASPEVLAFQQLYHKYLPNKAKEILDAEDLTNKGKASNVSKNAPLNEYLASNEDKYYGPRTAKYIASVDNTPVSLDLTNTPAKKEETVTTPVTTNNKYSEDKYLKKDIISAEKPTFVKEKFDYTQYLPEFSDLLDRSVRPWTKKYSPELLRAPTQNIQAELNANQADMYYGMQNLSNNPATRNANIANLMAQKYAANQGIYGAKYNADQQSRANVDNANAQLVNQAEQINYGRAKNQVDEQSQLLENEQLKKHTLFNSLVKKKAVYEADQQAKKFWFDIYSKNYNTDANGNITFAGNTTPIFDQNTNINNSIYAPKQPIVVPSTKTTVK
jgi:hypothetical protein